MFRLLDLEEGFDVLQFVLMQFVVLSGKGSTFSWVRSWVSLLDAMRFHMSINL